MGKLEKLEGWLEDHILVVCATALAILLILLGIACFVSGTHDDRTAWNDFADQMNRNADYYLEKNTGGPCGYVRTVGSTTYSVSISVSWSSSETANYTRIYAKEGGLALEWHTITLSDGDKVTSTTYIPYESICYVQANKVV